VYTVSVQTFHESEKMPKGNSKKQKRRANRNDNRSALVASNGDKWFSKTAMGIQSFLPRRQVAVFKQVMNAYYNTATAQPQGAFSINMSSFYEPFSNVGVAIGSLGANKSNLSLTAGFAIFQNPIGYQEIQALYQYYKVRRVMLRISLLALAAADAFNFYGAPSTAALSNYEPIYQGANPYGKNKLVGFAEKPVIVEWVLDAPTVLGYSKEQFAGLAPTIFGAAPTSPQIWYFNLGWMECNNTNPATGIVFDIELYQEVEVSELELFST
jgi:hypothetical protein